jgi:hypothetical protein
LLYVRDPLREALGSIAGCQADADHNDTARLPDAAVSQPVYQHKRSHAYPSQ